MSRRSGFTLLELLVAVALIALLASLLVPSLGAAGNLARRAVCAGNQQRLGAVLLTYASCDGRGHFPNTEGRCGHWMWDIDCGARDLLLRSGAQRGHFYCPACPAQNCDELWNFDGYVVTGYFFFTDRANRTRVRLTPGSQFHTGADMAEPAVSPLTADATISTGSADPEADDFTHVKGGWKGVHRTSHLARPGRPVGGNILFGDGHVAWREFHDMAFRAGWFPCPVQWW